VRAQERLKKSEKAPDIAPCSIAAVFDVPRGIGADCGARAATGPRAGRTASGPAASSRSGCGPRARTGCGAAADGLDAAASGPIGTAAATSVGRDAR